MKLKLSDWASIAEIVGAIAIVVTLIYVGIQVNDSTLAVRSASATETSTAISSWYSTLGANVQASDVFLRGITNPESLTPAETAQYMYLSHGLFFQYQGAYYLAEEGTLDTELQQSLVNTVLGVREQPGFLMYWEQRGSLFQPSFKAFVDDLIVNGDTNVDFERLYRQPGLD
jgi:hypothetical protein